MPLRSEISYTRRDRSLIASWTWVVVTIVVAVLTCIAEHTWDDHHLTTRECATARDAQGDMEPVTSPLTFELDISCVDCHVGTWWVMTKLLP